MVFDGRSVSIGGGGGRPRVGFRGLVEERLSSELDDEEVSTPSSIVVGIHRILDGN